MLMVPICVVRIKLELKIFLINIIMKSVWLQAMLSMPFAHAVKIKNRNPDNCTLCGSCVPHVNGREVLKMRGRNVSA